MKFNRIVSAAAVALLTLSALDAAAVPARQGFRTYTQPDGSTIELRCIGDEHGHIYLTPDGKTALRFDGAFYYVDAPAENSLLPVNTGILVGQEAPAINVDGLLNSLEQRRLRKVFSASPRRSAPASRADLGIPSPDDMRDSDVPTIGRVKGLVILVEYADYPFKVDDPYDFFNRFMHEEGFSDCGAKGSALDYFRASSLGQYDPEFDVYGPVQLPQKRSYYGGNDMYGDDKNPHQMAIQAVRQLDESVDFSQYDTDGDGYIDNVTVIYAGQGEADYGPDESVWPHAWYVKSGAGVNVKVDGVYLDRYNCINEWGMSAPAGIATFCHEFSHVLGLPDLYDTSYSTSVEYSPGTWSIMDYGTYLDDEHTPPMHSAYESYCLGWTTPELVEGPYNAFLEGSGSGQSILIKTDKDNEFFILEARTQEGWDAYQAGSGLAVWHIDFQRSKWTSNSVNTSKNHNCIDLIEADNRPGDTTRANDVFPGSTGVYDEFSYDTTPSFRSWSGFDMELPLTDIALENNGTMVTFRIAGGAPNIAGINASPAEDIEEDGFTAVWDASADAVAYELRIFNEDSGRYVNGMRCLNVGTAENPSRAGTVTRIVTGLEKGTNYSYSVRVVANNTRSDWSNAVDVLTKGSGAGLEDIETAVEPQGPKEYFDLRGIRITNPQPGAFYIVRQGNSSYKILFRE